MLERVTYICEFSMDTDGPAELGLGQELEVPEDCPTFPKKWPGLVHNTVL